MAIFGFLYAGVVEEKKVSPMKNVFCITLEQIVQVIRSSDGRDARVAVKAVNTQYGKQVCASAEYLVTEESSKKNLTTYPYQEVTNSAGTWQPIKVVIVGRVIPSGTLYFKPRYVHTTFLKIPAILGVNI